MKKTSTIDTKQLRPHVSGTRREFDRPRSVVVNTGRHVAGASVNIRLNTIAQLCHLAFGNFNDDEWRRQVVGEDTILFIKAKPEVYVVYDDGGNYKINKINGCFQQRIQIDNILKIIFTFLRCYID